jgi:hypothetical protein
MIEIVETKPPEKAVTPRHGVPEVFWPYFGNGTPPVPHPSRLWGGGVSFAEHLHRPLTEELWRYLHERLDVEFLFIYGPFDEIKTVGRLAGSCDIYLNIAGDVTDIIYFPRHRSRS